MSEVQPRSLVALGQQFRVSASSVGVSDADRCALAVGCCGAAYIGAQWLYYDLSPGACDLSLVEAGRCPLLIEHHAFVANMVGRVVAAEIAGGEMRALVEFGPGDEADRLLAYLRRGWPLSLSFGGSVRHSVPLDDAEDGTPRVMATSWQLREISVVVHGADQAAYLRPLGEGENPAEMADEVEAALAEHFDELERALAV